jgi:hypothetical protein
MVVVGGAGGATAGGGGRGGGCVTTMGGKRWALRAFTPSRYSCRRARSSSWVRSCCKAKRRLNSSSGAAVGSCWGRLVCIRCGLGVVICAACQSVGWCVRCGVGGEMGRLLGKAD